MNQVAEGSGGSDRSSHCCKMPAWAQGVPFAFWSKGVWESSLSASGIGRDGPQVLLELFFCYSLTTERAAV